MSKFVIYQLLPRYFSNNKNTNIKNGSIKDNGCGKLKDITVKALKSIKNLGVTHIWYTGIIEHATKTDYSDFNISRDHPAVVKGNAGSPYAIKDYYDVDPDLATDVNNRLKEFELLVKRTHKTNLKCIIDFVPNHLARNYFSDVSSVDDFGVNDNKNKMFAPDNNFYYLPGQHFSPYLDTFAGQAVAYEEYPAKVTGNDCFTATPSASDWYETVKLNYGVDYTDGKKKYFDKIPDTWIKMCDILLYWAGKGVDGFRCDMAEMVPVEFWCWSIAKVKEKYPEIIFIAEVYNPDEYRNYLKIGGFDFLYDKVGMYDTVRGIIECRSSTLSITKSWQSTADILPKMLYFLENHDEQRIGSSFFQKHIECSYPGLIVLATLQSNPFMVYSGQELGEQGMYEEGFSGIDGRSSIFDYWTIESLSAYNNNGAWNEKKISDYQKKIRSFYKKLLNVVLNNEIFDKGDFFDLMYVNIDNPDFNENRQYAYLKKYKNAFLICVVNFTYDEDSLSVIIPEHAFDFYGIEESEELEFEDLLTNKKYKIALRKDVPIKLNVPSNNGVLLRTFL